MRSNHQRTVRLFACLTLFVTALAACGSSAVTDATSSDSTAVETTTAEGDSTDSTTASDSASGSESTDPCGFDQALIDAAQAEGSVTVVGANAEVDGAFLGERFEEAYGISFTYNRQPTADAVQQVETAFEAGALTMDAALLAEPSAFVKWTGEGRLAEMTPPNADQFIPGLRDESRESLPVGTIGMGVLYSTANTDAADVPSSWADLMANRDDKVLALANPANSGSGLAYNFVLSTEIGEDYLDTAAGKRNLVTESGLTLTQMVLSNEADFGLPGYESEVWKAKANGEPLEVAYLDEVIPATSSEIGAFVDAPNPNAGKLFAEFTACDAVQSRIGEIGLRPVIEGAPAPEGLADLTGKNIVTADVNELITVREAIIDRFASSTK